MEKAKEGTVFPAPNCLLHRGLCPLAPFGELRVYGGFAMCRAVQSFYNSVCVSCSQMPEPGTPVMVSIQHSVFFLFSICGTLFANGYPADGWSVVFS